MEAIGKNRELTLTQVQNNTGEFAVTVATSSMSAEQLQAGYDAIMSQLEFWGNEAAKLKFGFLSGDKKEIANIEQIISIQSDRLAKYIELMQAPQNGGDVLLDEDGVPVQGDSEFNFNVSPLWFFGGLLLVAAVAGGKKNKKVMGKKKNDNAILWLGAGALALFFMTRKKDTPKNFVQPTPDSLESATPSGDTPEPIYYLPAPTDDAVKPNEPGAPNPYESLQEYTGEPTYYADGGQVVYTNELIRPLTQ